MGFDLMLLIKTPFLLRFKHAHEFKIKGIRGSQSVSRRGLRRDVLIWSSSCFPEVCFHWYHCGHNECIRQRQVWVIFIKCHEPTWKRHISKPGEMKFWKRRFNVTAGDVPRTNFSFRGWRRHCLCIEESSATLWSITLHEKVPKSDECGMPRELYYDGPKGKLSDIRCIICWLCILLIPRLFCICKTGIRRFVVV